MCARRAALASCRASSAHTSLTPLTSGPNPSRAVPAHLGIPATAPPKHTTTAAVGTITAATWRKRLLPPLRQAASLRVAGVPPPVSNGSEDRARLALLSGPLKLTRPGRPSPGTTPAPLRLEPVAQPVTSAALAVPPPGPPPPRCALRPCWPPAGAIAQPARRRQP
eukprot:scaffold12453_cov106-Isochrysis_galbana.AAC.5